MHLRPTSFSLTLLLLSTLAFAGNGPIDLGTPGLGGTVSSANGISLFNEHHIIVGAASLPGDANLHAFRTTTQGPLQDLGTLPLVNGPGNSVASAVSPFGMIAGTSDFDDPVAGRVSRAFYTTGGALTAVGTVGGSLSSGNGASDLFVVGSSTVSGESATHAFFFNIHKNQIADLGTLSGGINSAAFAVNDFGVVGGNSDASDGTTHAVLWTGEKIHDLGILSGGSFAQANGINELGIPVGHGDVADGTIHAWVGRKLMDIGSLGGSFASANAINDFGVVVGFSNTTGDTDVHAFMWTFAKGMVDLNTLLPAGSPWVLNSASGIADDGTIVGTGTLNGQSHAFAFGGR